MKEYTFEVSQRIVVTVAADSIAEAREDLLAGIDSGEYASFFDMSETDTTLIQTEELK